NSGRLTVYSLQRRGYCPWNCHGCKLKRKSEIILYSNSMIEPSFTLGKVNFLTTRFLLILSLYTLDFTSSFVCTTFPFTRLYVTAFRLRSSSSSSPFV